MDNPALPEVRRNDARPTGNPQHQGEPVALMFRHPSATEPIAEYQGSATRELLALVNARLYEILISGGEFDDICRHILAAPGKRVRARLVLASAGLLVTDASEPSRAALDLACAMDMLHESSLVHDDICDGSLLRRGATSVPAAFGVRIAARAGFHIAGAAVQLIAQVLADNPRAFACLGELPGVTYSDGLSELSFGQLIEMLPPAVEATALRRHYRLVAGAKTGTLFRLSCSYGGTAGGADHDRLRALMTYADELALAFQIMDDVRDIEGGPELGKDAGGDLERRVPTWPVIEWLEMRAGAREMWLSADTSSATLQADLIDSGATGAARAVALDATQKASAALDIFPSSSARDDLHALLQEVITR
ncbi:polyprenyl synthetase family protein [Nocardia salmonicida]|uniref:polyprenyl synthetase family protein n=1 Tax=Nocardia salmonicida TaxID=53431 RepID=UPI002E28E574|nr:polyprenyl synthetase family protein [Nocardia salmonicida]